MTGEAGCVAPPPAPLTPALAARAAAKAAIAGLMGFCAGGAAAGVISAVTEFRTCVTTGGKTGFTLLAGTADLAGEEMDNAAEDCALCAAVALTPE